MAKNSDGKTQANDGKSAGATARDWSKTLFLPRTDFPMKAGLPRREPELLKRWEEMGLYGRLREAAKGREKYILHDGPPYANGNIHLGTALNKILKDIITRSMQMMGYDSSYVPGWDCHGLPIEWKVEEEFRKKKKDKDAVPVNAFRAQCRQFAEKWIDVQRQEFKRLGVIGDWDNPYLTMTHEAEAKIAEELMKFAMNGSLYRGSKPVMWSVVEQTALAEAEVEYQEKQSTTIFVKFPLRDLDRNAFQGLDIKELVDNVPSVVIWTTTPWTIPGNRAIAFSRAINYGLYRVSEAADDNWTKPGELLIVADELAQTIREAGRIDAWERVQDVDPARLHACHHPFNESDDDSSGYYDFDVRLYEAEFVTADTGTGFVHIAPGHGADDYGLFEQNQQSFAEAGIASVPHTVRPDGFYFADVGLFGGDKPARVIDDRGKWGDANERVIKELVKRGALLARGRIKHDYPHSWRSKKPVIFRNTPQWFIAMDKPIDIPGVKGKKSIREVSLGAIDDTRFVPAAGQNRLRGMIENKPDWVISRQRAWGVPICVFFHKDIGEIIPNADFKGADALQQRIVDAFTRDGADAWFTEGARERFLDGLVDNPDEWEQVGDILDVWFDSGSTHAFVLEERADLKWPADLYLEGSDQHRGWFHSSLIESCATRGRAPYDAVLTHGFVMAEDGRKMSKSLNNQVFPQDVIKQSGAEILRLWTASSDYSDDLRIGPEILKSNTDAYRKMRNTIRWLLGNLGSYDEAARVKPSDMPELERLMLHELHALDQVVRKGYLAFDFKRVFHALSNFCINDLSAFYFDIRKDALYCDPKSSPTRRACLTVLDEIFNHLTAWLAPIMCFTMEEAWLARFPGEDSSVHLRLFPDVPEDWRNDDLAAKWNKIRKVRCVVTGALEVERREKRIGSSLESAPEIYVSDEDLAAALDGIDLAEISITSGATLKTGQPPGDAFTMEEIAGVAVVPKAASGTKCARSWKYTDDVGSDPDFPELSARDAAAVRELDAMNE